MDWPGWEQDRALAARHSAKLRRELKRAVDARDLIRRWDATYAIPSRWQDSDAEEFLYANGQAGKIQGVISLRLDELWREAWELGVVSAMQMSGNDSQRKPELALAKGSKTWKCDLGHKHDAPGAAGMLIRHQTPGEKRKFLLHKRADDNTWCNFGGGLHPGESPWDGAKRECTEEAGELPDDLKYHHTVVDDHGGWQHHLFVMDSPKIFHPAVDGKTPDEVGGTGWFTKKEIKHLDLFGPLRDTWDTVKDSDDDVAINSAMQKGWKNPLRGIKPAPLTDDPWRDIRDQLRKAGVPADIAGPMASAYLTWENYSGATGIIGMVATLAGKLADILLRRRRGELTAPEAASEVNGVLTDESHALRIAATEAAKAINNAALEAYVITNNVEWVRWVTARDALVCAACRRNAAAGAIPIDKPFPSGSMLPPEHPHCRCVLVPADPAPRTRHEEMINPRDWMPYESHKASSDSKVSKASVNYRKGTDARHCGNCSMIRMNPPDFESHSCTLVQGLIEPAAVCDEWEARDGKKSAETAELATHHAPIGHEGLWHSKHPPLQLPAYIQNIRNALMRNGMGEREAHAMAVAAVERWAKGNLKWGPHRHVTPEVQRASADAVRQWEQLRASHP